MHCILFTLISFLTAEAAFTSITFSKYTYDRTTNLATWDTSKADNTLTVNWDEGPYHFGLPADTELNVFDKQGITFTKDTIAIKSNISSPDTDGQRLNYHLLHLYEYQSAVLAAYYGLNIVPSDYYFGECGAKQVKFIGSTGSSETVGTSPDSFPYFIVGVNDLKCYGTQGSVDGKCKTQCLNGDNIDIGTYGKDLLTFVSTNQIESEEALKKLIAKFGPVSVENNVWEIYYGWRTIVEDQSIRFLKFRISGGQLEFSDNGQYAGQGGFRVAYIETFPEKKLAYNPCTTDTLPEGGCTCTIDKHPASCTCPEDLTDIPKDICPCPASIDEHEKDPRKEGICKCPEKGTSEYKTDPRAKEGLACSASFARTTLSMIMMALIVPILAFTLW